MQFTPFKKARPARKYFLTGVKKRSSSTGFTEFEKKVLKCVLTIPLGEVRTYKWVAKKIGNPKAYRAVGNVLNKNPFPLIIPCHRVVKASGSTGGFSSGKANKKRLINLEKKIKNMLK